MQGPRSSALFSNHDSNCFPIVMNARFVVETEVMYQQWLWSDVQDQGNQLANICFLSGISSNHIFAQCNRAAYSINPEFSIGIWRVGAIWWSKTWLLMGDSPTEVPGEASLCILIATFHLKTSIELSVNNCPNSNQSEHKWPGQIRQLTNWQIFIHFIWEFLILCS